MTDAEREYFETELIHQRSQVLGRVNHRTEPGERVGADGVPDFADYAAEKAEIEVVDRIADSEANLLAKIDLALDRIKDGSYHLCADCGSEIPIERLKAKPTVSLCVGCQEKKEAALS